MGESEAVSLPEAIQSPSDVDSGLYSDLPAECLDWSRSQILLSDHYEPVLTEAVLTGLS